MSETKRIGRPTKVATPGARVSLGLKVTPSIKRLLDEAARANGRTQSQEAEVRLERSFERESLLFEALDLAYGRQIAGLLLLLGEVIEASARLGGARSPGPVIRGQEFTNDAARKQAGIAAAAIVNWLRSQPFDEGLSSKGNPGVGVAASYLDWLEGHGHDRWDAGPFVAAARERLLTLLPKAEKPKP